MNAQPKPSFTIVTAAAAEIASIVRNEYTDIIGGKDPSGQHWAYTESLREWRERQKQPNTDSEISK